MALEIEYRGEYTDITAIGSESGLDWRVDFLRDNYLGAIKTLAMSDPPHIFNFDNESDNVFDAIRKSYATFSFYASVNFIYQALYSTEMLEIKVNVYANDALFWEGWLEPFKYTEAYEPIEYEVSVTATDGLSLLSCPYKDWGGNPFTGRRFESQILFECLEKIGHTELKEYINVYEDNINNSADDSPLDQILIDASVFTDRTCLEVIERILEKYNAFIRQKDGVFNLVRPKELIGATVYGRHFTAYNTKTSISFAPLQNIDTVGYASDRLQIPGGVKMIQSPIHEAKIKHDFGNKESWLNNYLFKSNTYSDEQFDSWTNIGAVAVTTVSALIKSELEGCFIVSQDTYPSHSRCIRQIFGSNAAVTTNDLTLEFDYMYYNTHTANVSTVAFYIEVKNSAGTRWLSAGVSGGGSHSIVITDATWETAQDYIICVEDAPPGITGWINVKLTVPGLPVVGPYQINIFSLTIYSPAIYVGIKNVRFFTYTEALSLKSEMKDVTESRGWFLRNFTSYQQKVVPKWSFITERKAITEEEYTAINNINGDDVESNVLLGDVIDDDMDNIHEQFAGALAYAVTTPLYRVDDIILTTDTASGSALITNNGYSETATWNTSLAQTATDFITNHNSDFPGVTLSSGGSGVIRFTHNTAGVEFIGATSIVNTDFDLDGYLSKYQPDLFSMSSIQPTQSWSTGNNGSGGESLPLLQIMANEVAAMYSRPKELIQMPIMETAKALQINTIGSFQHAVNTYSGAIRIFCMNRGEFDVRNRQWTIDLFEIGTGAAPVGGGSATADSTLITSDSTLITSDTTI